ncbi:hypothetical protein SAMN04489722_1011 [Algibacter lectus]|uniref:hypothetical protein n=1 Tax=Algibacter lectus TaxID=221126 RepID=UPI0008F2B0DC|nr:hypothetical protein [Algibacter lectus]SFB81654.1 hypothetical protein SAMN04489722_1011 [Algibacter lectus]
MNKLIPIEERESKLLKFGAPKLFIDNIGKIPELEFTVEYVTNAYSYIPDISYYEILKGFNVIPIYDEGESFYVFLYNDKVKKIIHFELENDEIYNSYGQNWNHLLLDIMINCFDLYLEDEITQKEYIEIGNKIGFEQTAELFKLRNLPKEELNKKFENNDEWEMEIAKKLKIL